MGALPAFLPQFLLRHRDCSLDTHSKWARLIHLQSVTMREPGSWPSWNGSLLCYLTVVQPREVNLHLVLKCCCLSQQAGLKCIPCRPCLECLNVPSGARLCWPLWAQNVSEAAPWATAVCAGVWVIAAFASWPIVEAEEREDICHITTFWSYFCMKSDYFYSFLC